MMPISRTPFPLARSPTKLIHRPSGEYFACQNRV
jgi:hypothetical protein